MKRCEDVEILEGSDSNFDVCEGSQQSKHKNGCEDFRGSSDQPVLSVPVVTQPNECASSNNVVDVQGCVVSSDTHLVGELVDGDGLAVE